MPKGIYFHLKGKGSAHWKGGQKRYNCLFCKKQFNSYKKKAKFCSLNCFGKHYKGKSFSQKSLFKKGHISWLKGTKGIVKPNKGSYKKGRISERRGKEFPQISNENHWNWQGGKSHEPYPFNWRTTFKIKIRERDKYTCQICKKRPAMDCHHIDYDKKNCNLKNLITLCRNCHTKTNFKRENWIKFFKGLNNN